MVKNSPLPWDKLNRAWTKLVLRGLSREAVEAIEVWCSNNTVHGWMYHPVIYAYPQNAKSGYICFKFENRDDAFAFKLLWSKHF